MQLNAGHDAPQWYRQVWSGALYWLGSGRRQRLIFCRGSWWRHIRCW